MSIDKDLQLSSYCRSSAAYRVRIALEIKLLSYKTLPINLLTSEHRQPEYLQIDILTFVPRSIFVSVLFTPASQVPSWLF